MLEFTYFKKLTITHKLSRTENSQIDGIEGQWSGKLIDDTRLLESIYITTHTHTHTHSEELNEAVDT